MHHVMNHIMYYGMRPVMHHIMHFMHHVMHQIMNNGPISLWGLFYKQSKTYVFSHLHFVCILSYACIKMHMKCNIKHDSNFTLHLFINQFLFNRINKQLL